PRRSPLVGVSPGGKRHIYSSPESVRIKIPSTIFFSALLNLSRAGPSSSPVKAKASKSASFPSHPHSSTRPETVICPTWPVGQESTATTKHTASTSAAPSPTPIHTSKSLGRLAPTGCATGSGCPGAGGGRLAGGTRAAGVGGTVTGWPHARHLLDRP